MDLSKSVEIYRPTLAALLPGVSGDEERYRAGLLYLRDRALRARPIATTDNADVLLRAIAQIAGDYALAPMDADELETLHRAMVRVMVSAQRLETNGPGRPNNDR